jgi:ABC-type sugar transport system ATPase subunit
MIALEQVSVAAGDFRLDNVSFQVPAGGYVALMGKTGSGKTTILEAICGLKPVLGGNIRILDREVTCLKPAQRGLGYVPQDRALFSSMAVGEHLAFALRIRGWPVRDITARVTELADMLGLITLLHRLPHGLSGGEAQRVALGRALSFRPSVLLLDEPLSALDTETKAEMRDLLRAVRKHTGVTTLHVTHDFDEARELADRILSLKDGRIEESNVAGPLRVP